MLVLHNQDWIHINGVVGKSTSARQRKCGPVHRLPLEIIDLIGGYLWGFRKALQACALTCRSWQAVFRPHIFRRIIIDSDTKLNDLEAALDAEPIIGYWVRELSVETPAKRTSNFRNNTAPWMARLPVLLPKQLKRLRAIDVMHINDAWSWTRKEWENLVPQFNAFTTVKQLTFLNCYLTDYVVKILSHSLPSLEDLHFHNSNITDSTVWLNGVIQTIPPPDLSPVRLRSLRIHSDGGARTTMSRGILPWFDHCDTLRDVQVHVDSPTDLVRVGSFIASLPSTVQNLELAFPCKESFRDVGTQCESEFLFGLPISISSLNTSALTLSLQL